MLLLWLAPWTYRFFTAESAYQPFTLYSSIIKDFAIIDINNDKDLVYSDLANNIYTEEQFDSILPFFYTRQLVQDERLPDSINGIEVSPKIIQHDNIMFFSKPIDINKKQTGLFFLLESMSKRVDLKMPNDVFRTTDKGLEFIDMESNEINREKSNLFTEAMLRKGFKFPVTEINGNATTRKDYDEGYVMLDSENKLYQLKQVKGRPYVKLIEKPKDIRLKHLFITEFKNRKSVAFATDENNQMYVIENKTYDIKKVEIPSFDPKKENLRLIGNMMDWTINISSETRNDYYAVDSEDYSLIKKYENKSESEWPSLHFTDYRDNFAYPRFD